MYVFVILLCGEFWSIKLEVGWYLFYILKKFENSKYS